MQYLRKVNFNTLVTVIFFVALGIYFLGNRQDLNQLLTVSIAPLLALYSLKAARIFITGLFTKLTVDVFGKKISLKETNYLSLLSSLGNFFGPILGGASIRAVYLKTRHNLEYSKFISTLYGFYIVTFATNALLGLVMSWFIFRQQGASSELFAVTVVFSGVLMVNILLMIFPLRLVKRLINKATILPRRIEKILRLITEGWGVLKQNKKLLIQLFLLNIVILFIATIESFILFNVYVTSFTLVNVLAYTILGTLSTLISFTPGAIGIKESIFLLAAGVIALSPSQVLQIATIDRGVSFSLLLVLFAASKLMGTEKKISSDKESK